MALILSGFIVMHNNGESVGKLFYVQIEEKSRSVCPNLPSRRAANRLISISPRMVARMISTWRIALAFAVTTIFVSVAFGNTLRAADLHAGNGKYGPSAVC